MRARFARVVDSFTSGPAAVAAKVAFEAEVEVEVGRDSLLHQVATLLPHLNAASESKGDSSGGGGGPAEGGAGGAGGPRGGWSLRCRFGVGAGKTKCADFGEVFGDVDAAVLILDVLSGIEISEREGDSVGMRRSEFSCRVALSSVSHTQAKSIFLA